MTEPSPPRPAPRDPAIAALSLRGRPSSAWLAFAALLLAVHFALAVGSKFSASTTSDELVHLTAGLSYWQNNDYRLHPENGNLPQRWAALPAWLVGAQFPPLEKNIPWRLSSAWGVGAQFFYHGRRDHFPLLMAGRAMIALFSVTTGALVFWLAWQFFGGAGAAVALSLFAFSPEFLAHGALVTSDACVAFFFLAASCAWWWHLHDGRWSRWWLSALVLSFAFVAKFSAVLLVVVMVVTALIRAAHAGPLRFGRWMFVRPVGKITAAALSALGHALVVAVIIWASYGFRFAAFNPALPSAAHFIKPWEDFVGQTGLAGEIARSVAQLKLLPEAFLYGFDYVLATVKTRSAFLNGDYSMTGWRSFFLWTFLFKTPLPLLLLVAALGVTFVVRARKGRTALKAWYPATPLITLFVVYWLSQLTSRLNIGHRHLLPIYPLLFIAAGAAGAWLVSHRRWLAVSTAALLAWHSIEGIRITPHHLAYFNPIAGGPANGWRHLVDSSLDWGQDLPALQRWLEANAGNERVYLSYFGTGDPDYYRIRATWTGFVSFTTTELPYVELKPGLYCVSATVLQQVYASPPGSYTAEKEKLYQELRVLEPQFARFSRDPTSHAELTRIAPLEHWQKGLHRFDGLRLGRLCSYLRARGPDAHAGYSILIFRVDAEELRIATEGSPRELSALIERAVATRS